MTKLSPELATGQPEIDNHHKELFQLISSLDTAIRSGNPDEVDDIIQFLEGYTTDHFKEEEDYMSENKYDKRDHHQAEHVKLRRKVESLRYDFDQGPEHSRTHVIFMIRRFIDDLVSHIKTVDKGLKDIKKGTNG